VKIDEGELKGGARFGSKKSQEEKGENNQKEKIIK